MARDGRLPDLGSDQGAKQKAIGIRSAPGGVADCSQSCSQFVTRSLPSVQLPATDILDHIQAPLGRRVAEKGVGGPCSGANLALEFRSRSYVSKLEKRLKDTACRSEGTERVFERLPNY